MRLLGCVIHRGTTKNTVHHPVDCVFFRYGERLRGDVHRVMRPASGARKAGRSRTRRPLRQARSDLVTILFITSFCTHLCLEARNAGLYDYRRPDAHWYTGYDPIACVFFALFPGKVLDITAKRDRWVRPHICRSRFFERPVFSRVNGNMDQHPPPIPFGVSRASPKGPRFRVFRVDVGSFSEYNRV